jgi:hypothetical protein
MPTDFSANHCLNKKKGCRWNCNVFSVVNPSYHREKQGEKLAKYRDPMCIKRARVEIQNEFSLFLPCNKMISSFIRKFCSTPEKAVDTPMTRNEFNKMCLEELKTLKMPLGIGAAASLVPGAGLASAVSLYFWEGKYDPKNFIVSGLLACTACSNIIVAVPAGISCYLFGKMMSPLMTRFLEPVVDRELVKLCEEDKLPARNSKFPLYMFLAAFTPVIAGMLFFPLPTYGIMTVGTVALVSFDESMTNIALKKGLVVSPKSYVMLGILHTVFASIAIDGVISQL